MFLLHGVSRVEVLFDAYTLKVNNLLIGNTYQLFCVIFEKYIQFRI